jgi:hypothetical protein
LVAKSELEGPEFKSRMVQSAKSDWAIRPPPRAGAGRIGWLNGIGWLNEREAHKKVQRDFPDEPNTLSLHDKSPSQVRSDG